MYLFTKRDLNTFNTLRLKSIKNKDCTVVNQVTEAIYNFIVFCKMGMSSPARSQEIEELCSLFTNLNNLIAENKITKENLQRERNDLEKEHYGLGLEAY